MQTYDPSLTIVPRTTDDYYNRAELRARGWTRSQIKTRLTPDGWDFFDCAWLPPIVGKTLMSPRWLKDNVHTVETTAAWKDYRATADRAIQLMHGDARIIALQSKRRVAVGV